MINRILSLQSLFCAVVIFLSACQDNVSTNLEDSLDLFAGLEEIPEASQSSVTINQGADDTADGYFTISVDNITANRALAPGLNEAWCLEWHKSLRSNGDVHDNVKWYDTSASTSWKPLNYFFSIRGELQADDPELTYRDIQAVVWVLAGKMGIAPEFDVLNLPADRIPSRLRDGSELAIDREKVAGIARRVMKEAPQASGVPAGAVAQTARDEQDIFTPAATYKVAFFSQRAGDREVYLVDSDGTNLVNLSNNGAEDFQQSISVDGQRVTFISNRDGNFEIYVVDADGSNLTNLSNNAAADEEPTISANGQRVAFKSNRDGNNEIYVVDADGSNLTNLTNNAAADIQPTISADGQRVVFQSNRDGNAEIYVVDSDGSNLTRLTNNAALDELPSISADGQRVIFQSNRDGNSEIYVVDSDGTNLTNLSNSAAFDRLPSISADGQRIAFTSNRDGNFEIYVVDFDGSNLTRLTNNPGLDLTPSISADGQRVAFQSNRDGNFEIYVVDADGSNLMRLTNNAASDVFTSISGLVP
ncbi:MAG: DUF5050 domain-containing protein [Bacteroidetes bacterium]|jgi:Tol biopolymer transport system component|nr:DUF5050 domain-containing protein [Bacteroidota bacterium]